MECADHLAGQGAGAGGGAGLSYLLDTNVVAEVRRPRPDAGVMPADVLQTGVRLINPFGLDR